MNSTTTIWREIPARRNSLINTYGGDERGRKQCNQAGAYSAENISDFAKDMQLQLGSVQVQRPRLAVIECVSVRLGVCAMEWLHKYACLFVSVCLYVLS